MPFKEGVKEEDVNIFRAWVKLAKELDEAIDTGHITPQEAFDKLKSGMSGKKDPDTKKETK
jgi:hypothetical protein